jgi:hypothetical protein
MYGVAKHKYFMRLNEFSSPINKFLVTVKVHGTSVKTLIHAESQSQARLLVGKIFGKDNVQSVNSISTNESKNTISLNLHETVNADDLVSLWQIVSQNVFQAVEKERREAEEAQRLEASKPKRSRAVRSPSRSVNAVKAVRPKTVRPKTLKSQATLQASKPQVTKPQSTVPQSVSKHQTPQMIQVARPQMQTQQQPRTQQPMMPKTTSVQPTQRTNPITQPIANKSQLPKANQRTNQSLSNQNYFSTARH